MIITYFCIYDFGWKDKKRSMTSSYCCVFWFYWASVKIMTNDRSSQNLKYFLCNLKNRRITLIYFYLSVQMGSCWMIGLKRALTGHIFTHWRLEAWILIWLIPVYGNLSGGLPKVCCFLWALQFTLLALG